MKSSIVSNSVNEIKIKKLINKLTQEIKFYNKEYFINHKMPVADVEYDQLFILLKKLETLYPKFALSDSPTQTVGYFTQPESIKSIYVHKIPMLSLDNAFVNQDVKNFILRSVKKIQISFFLQILCEPKIDGISFSAIYKFGKLMIVSTRGDGIRGENITNVIEQVRNFPIVIDNQDSYFEVRGEFYITKFDFVKVNTLMNISGKLSFANPRNLVSGSVRNVHMMRPIKYFVYFAVSNYKSIANSQHELLYHLRLLGFCVNSVKDIVSYKKYLFNFYNKIIETKNNLPYHIDGIVYKINNLLYHNLLGINIRCVKYAIAYKFPSIIVETKLLDVIVNVSKSGILVPVGLLEKVYVGNVVISKVSLHNFCEIHKLGIMIGDVVRLYRAGDVIPKVLSVNFAKRSNFVKSIILPTFCPSCGESVTKDGCVIKCINVWGCARQRYKAILHAISFNGFNIKGLGEAQLMLLLRQKYIHDVCDIFLLPNQASLLLKKLTCFVGWGQKSVQNLLLNISYARTVELSNFIFSLGILGVGQKLSNVLSQEFKQVSCFIFSMKRLSIGYIAIRYRLKSLYGVSNKIINNIIMFFNCDKNIILVDKLVSILYIKNVSSVNVYSPLKNHIILFTGRFISISRYQCKYFAQKLGGQVTSIVSKKITMLIVGEIGRNKKYKVLDYVRNIIVLSEKDWMQLLRLNFLY